jgi:hypothetical protein
VFIYYGDYPNFADCTSASQIGANMITLADLRYDTSQFPGGTFYDNHAHALTLLGTLPITAASLVVDSGWGGDQMLTLTNATVNTNIFIPASGGSLPTCTLPPATIQITKADGTPTGATNEPTTIQPADNNSQFRVVGCSYMYNLDTSSLSGAGRYEVTALINGTPAAGAATFDLR